MQSFSDALRLAIGRAPKYPDAPLTPRRALALVAVLVLLEVGMDRLMAGRGAEFSLYGVNSLFAWLAVSLAVIALFSRHHENGADARRLMLLWFGATLFGYVGLAAAIGYDSLSSSKTGMAAAFGLAVLAPIFGSRRIFTLAGSRWPTVKAVGFALSLAVAQLSLPHWPLFQGENFNRANANLWEATAAALRSKPSEAETAGQAKDRHDALQRISAIEAAQPWLLDGELENVRPRTPGKPNLFVVGVAGWSSQRVFLKETEASLDILRKRLGAEGRTVALVNNRASAMQHPIANLHNLTHVLRGVAAKMNVEEDILLLTMTSHGSEEGVALRYGPLVERALAPEALRAILDGVGIKNRIVIVSACHSGVFVPALSDPRTMVITAARSDRTSFGCADDRDWTAFGEAFFAHGLNETQNLTQAFDKAKARVAELETSLKIDASEPQISVGEELRRRFPALVGPAMEGANPTGKAKRACLPASLLDVCAPGAVAQRG